MPCLRPRLTRLLPFTGRTEHIKRAVEALFGFERDGHRGRPMGAPMNDFQGVIAAPGTVFDADALMRMAGLRVMAFETTCCRTCRCLASTSSACCPRLIATLAAVARCMTGGVAVCEGHIETGTLQRVFGRRRRAMIAALRASAAWEQLRALKRRYLPALRGGDDSAALPSPDRTEH